MEALRAVSSSSCFHLPYSSRILPKTQIEYRPIFCLPSVQGPISSLSSCPTYNKSRFNLYTSISSTASTELTDRPEQEPKIQTQDDKFDWFSQWYPIMPVCDLDKRAPHGKQVIGLDIVVWWDRNENAWKVFDDACPHRLAPLSEGRIDQWGRLQCVYHGWCFGGSGDCKFIPQAPRDGPPIHTSKKACVAVYPSVAQNGIVWFWPNADPEYKDILLKKKPPYIPELDDPSYTRSMGSRDIPYGYEVLTENFMDPAHVPYAHYKIMGVRQRKNSQKADREGGKPLEISINKQDINGYSAKQEIGGFNFVAPCVFHGYATLGEDKGNESATSAVATEELSSRVPQKRILLIFITVPVSPGHSRLIWSFPRNFGVWIDRVVPRWIFHIGQNLILDSDLYLLHTEEHKIMDVGPSNWQKACFVPTKADTLVVAFRRWLKKHSGGQIDWGTKFGAALPPTPPREQLLDRYRSHVVSCRSCSAAYKGLNALEVVLQIISIASLGIVVATKPGIISAFTRYALVAMAVLSFTVSKLLSHFIYKNFHFHDYNHAFR